MGLFEGDGLVFEVLGNVAGLALTGGVDVKEPAFLVGEGLEEEGGEGEA